jgi:hypothetical protein
MRKSEKIAIVIPYFKPNYLDHLLSLLEREVETNISVYFFDDASPFHSDVWKNKFQNLIYKYLRFDDNLGGASLTAQWERCLLNTEDEEWVWFIPDDDLLEAGTIAKVCRAIESAPSDVALLHLSTVVVDGLGRDVGFQDTMPAGNYEASEFYYRILCSQSMITLGSQVYRRSKLNTGFIEFPKGWGSDHATTLNSAGEDFIMHLTDARIQFRMSDFNISSQYDDWRQKSEARVQFANWLFQFLKSKEAGGVNFERIRKSFLTKGESFFVRVCPFDWFVFLYSYRVAKSLGAPFAVVYPIKIGFLKLVYFIRGRGFKCLATLRDQR